MEVLCLLNVLAERIAAGTSPKFVEDIARFVFPSCAGTSTSSHGGAAAAAAAAAASPTDAKQQQKQQAAESAAARYSEARLGVFAGLFHVNQQLQRISQQEQRQPKQAPREDPDLMMSTAAGSAERAAEQAVLAGCDAVSHVPVAIVIAGAGQDWNNSGISGGAVDAGATAAAAGSAGGRRRAGGVAARADNGATGGNRNALVEAISAAAAAQLGARGPSAAALPSPASSSSAVADFTFQRVIACPNDAERVAELVTESAAAAHRFRTARLRSLQQQQQQQQQAPRSATSKSKNGVAPISASQQHADAVAREQRLQSAVPRGRVVCVYQMGESCQLGSEDLQRLGGALSELLSCRARFHRAVHLDFAAVIVVRSPWHSAVLLGLMQAPPLAGMTVPRVFESDSSNGERAFPLLLFHAMRHFPFCVVSEPTFHSVCVAWNSAHRMQDLIHALHRAITAHLRQFPDLECESNRVNRAAVNALVAFCLDASGGGSSNNSGAADDLCAKSFTTLYYEVLVKRNASILEYGLRRRNAAGGGAPNEADERRRRLCETLAQLVPRVMSAGNVGDTSSALLHGATAARSAVPREGALTSRPSQKHVPSNEGNSATAAAAAGSRRQRDEGERSDVVDDDDDDDDDPFALPRSKKADDRAAVDDDAADDFEDEVDDEEAEEEQHEDLYTQLLEAIEGDAEEAEARDAVQEESDAAYGPASSSAAAALDMKTPARQLLPAVSSAANAAALATANAPSTIGSLPGDTMVFPAIAFNSVKAFLASPLRFDDAKSGDVVRLVCVLARHFRTGTTITHLCNTLGDRRRTLIALHEAAAAGIIFVRLDSGIVRLVT